MKSQKKALLWDLGNVLTTFQNRYDVLKKIITDHRGNPRALDDLFPNSHEGTNLQERESVYEALDLGRISFSQLHGQICRQAGISISFQEFCASYSGHLQPIVAVMEIYRKLQKRYRMVVVSNGDFAARVLVQALEVRDGLQFDQVFISYEQGRKKPKLFEKVLEYLTRLNISPTNTLLIDDSYSAEPYSISSIRFDGSKQLVEDLIAALKEHGVIVP